MYKCNECSAQTIKWAWQCPECKSWNTLEEIEKIPNDKKTRWRNLELNKIENLNHLENKMITSSSELNNLLGGWIVEWSIVLLSWEPGIGKSTLTLQIWWWLADKEIIYVSWEETSSQIMSRAHRLGVKSKNIWILSETNLENILETIKSNKSDLVIIDSISVLHSGNISGSSGNINQIRYIWESLQEFAKKNNTAVIIIWHITKDWSLAWPKSLEHLVDTVLYFEWDRYDDIRLLRCFKNRFGNTSEVGIFKMTEKWLIDMENPWLEFIESETKEPTIGASLSITVEGTRPLIVECEALTTYTKFGYPKRSSRGISQSKLDLIIAVLSKYTTIKLDSYDVYANIARGIRIDEPGIDLSILASIISSKVNKPLPRDTIYIWEISLTGKIKKVFSIEKRVKEAEKMWFKNIFIPAGTQIKTKKINIIEVSSMWDLVKLIYT